MRVSHKTEKIADQLKRSIQIEHDQIDDIIRASVDPLHQAKRLLAHMRELYLTPANAKLWGDTWPIRPDTLDQVLDQSKNPELDFALYYLINGSEMGLSLLRKESNRQETYQAWQKIRQALDQRFTDRSFSLPLISGHAREIMNNLRTYLTTRETSQ